MDQDGQQGTWSADPDATFARRLGISPYEPDPADPKKPPQSGKWNGCPDFWELSNGDFAVIGRDLTTAYRSKLPDDVSLRPDERLVVVPREMMLAAKADIPDA